MATSRSCRHIRKGGKKISQLRVLSDLLFLRLSINVVTFPLLRHSLLSGFSTVPFVENIGTEPLQSTEETLFMDKERGGHVCTNLEGSHTHTCAIFPAFFSTPDVCHLLKNLYAMMPASKRDWKITRLKAK